MQKITLLSFLFLMSITFFGAHNAVAQVCNSELTVVGNRDSRSAAPNDATIFQLELKNNSSKSQSYTISSNISDQKCDASSSISRSGSSVDMQVSVMNKNNVRSSTVTVAPGASVPLLVQVSVGSNLQFNKWYCVELLAVSDLCNSKTISKNLKVYASDGSDN